MLRRSPADCTRRRPVRRPGAARRGGRGSPLTRSRWGRLPERAVKERAPPVSARPCRPAAGGRRRRALRPAGTERRATERRRRSARRLRNRHRLWLRPSRVRNGEPLRDRRTSVEHQCDLMAPLIGRRCPCCVSGGRSLGRRIPSARTRPRAASPRPHEACTARHRLRCPGSGRSRPAAGPARSPPGPIQEILGETGGDVAPTRAARAPSFARAGLRRILRPRSHLEHGEDHRHR